MSKLSPNYADRICAKCQLAYVEHIDDTTELCMSCRRGEAEKICRENNDG